MSQQSRGPAPRRRTPRVERLETRDLPTVVPHHVAPITTPSTGITSVLQGFSGTPTAPAPTATGGLPTQGEVKRERYVARYVGDYIIGPGRYTDQALALSSIGDGTTTQALHSSSQMRIVVPKDSTVAPTGQIYIIAPSIATTGSSLVLDLTGDPTTSVHGVPSHYTWTVDASSAGLYQEAQGSGTLDLTYGPARPGPVHGAIQGPLHILIQGFVNVVGIFNDIGGFGNLPNGKRAQG